MPLPPLPLLLQGADDLKREAGLRGDQFDAALLGLIAVFVVALVIVVVVLLLGRRRGDDRGAES